MWENKNVYGKMEIPIDICGNECGKIKTFQ
jgi:hypothetical protein